MRHETDIRSVSADAPRPLGRSILRGWRRRCPNCGGGPMMASYLKVRKSCAACGEPLHHHRADDMPAWATILIVGHILVGAMVSTEVAWSPPVWVHWAIWPALGLTMALLLLPRIKGLIVAMQWAWGMHGFGEED